jgi:hypothetical protein
MSRRLQWTQLPNQTLSAAVRWVHSQIHTFEMNHFDATHRSSEDDSRHIPACTDECTSDIQNGLMPTPRKVVQNCRLSAADIVLLSSDGHRFGTHCKNLGEFTGGLPLEWRRCADAESGLRISTYALSPIHSSPLSG